MNYKITIPTSLNEITLGQYQEFTKLSELPETELQLKAIEIFCNVPREAVRGMKATDITEISNIINNMFDTKHQLINSFKLDGIEYGFIPSLEDMTFGEYIDLDTFIGDNDNLHRAVNVLFRPMEMKRGNRYFIKEYQPEDFEKAKDFPLDAVLGAIVFFYSLGKDLSTVMINSLDKKNEEILAEYLISQESGDGTTPSLQSLTEILQNLNISLN